MHNIPHSEETKQRISERLKEHWQNLTEQEKKERRKKISAFYQFVNDKEREEQIKQWERLHREYIYNEYQRLFKELR